MMPAENIYDLFITDGERNIILEERAITARKTESIIRDYPWSASPRSHAQLWKQNSKFSFIVNYVASLKKYEVGFSDRASRFVGATYGLLDTVDQLIEPLYLFYQGDFEKLEQFLAKHRPEQKGD